VENDQFIGSVTAFKNDNETCVNRPTLVQVTAAYADGSVELAFDVPNSRDRIYLTVKLGELVGHAIALEPSGD
jgi:hypothetical protein